MHQEHQIFVINIISPKVMLNFDFLDEGFYDDFALLSCKEPMICRVDLGDNSPNHESSDDSSQFLDKFRAYCIEHYLLDHHVCASNVNRRSRSSPGLPALHIADETYRRSPPRIGP